MKMCLYKSMLNWHSNSFTYWYWVSWQPSLQTWHETWRSLLQSVDQVSLHWLDLFLHLGAVSVLPESFRSPPQWLLILSPRLHVTIPPTRNHPSFDHQRYIWWSLHWKTFSVDSVLHDSKAQTGSNNFMSNGWCALGTMHWCEIYSRNDWTIVRKGILIQPLPCQYPPWNLWTIILNPFQLLVAFLRNFQCFGVACVTVIFAVFCFSFVTLRRKIKLLWNGGIGFPTPGLCIL